MKSRGEERRRTDLINENPDHIALRSLQRPKCSTKVELDIILLAFHAHTDE
jgi:hypothetical protein